MLMRLTERDPQAMELTSKLMILPQLQTWTSHTTLIDGIARHAAKLLLLLPKLLLPMPMPRVLMPMLIPPSMPMMPPMMLLNLPSSLLTFRLLMCLCPAPSQPLLSWIARLMQSEYGDGRTSPFLSPTRRRHDAHRVHSGGRL